MIEIAILHALPGEKTLLLVKSMVYNYRNTSLLLFFLSLFLNISCDFAESVLTSKWRKKNSGHT